jgi:hypothetical protein
MIESAAGNAKVDGDAAAALTESYSRFRDRVRALVEQSSADLEEFDAAFPEIPLVEIDAHESMREIATRGMRYAPDANRAQALLRQLAGWVSGLIEELRHEQEAAPQPRRNPT